MDVTKLILLMYLLFFPGENIIQEDVLVDDNQVYKIIPDKFIEKLPGHLNENSGLIYYNNLTWSFNDSGGENLLFGFNRSGEITVQIRLANAENRDWEDIAQDDNFIYIGDFGNNNGTRKDLKVLKISKSEINTESHQTIETETISFSFSNQKQFSYSPLSTPFDCESLTDIDGELYLFSKRWNDETTMIYNLPKVSGDYSVEPLDSFQVGGLITGADFNPESSTLALSGYHNFKPLVWLFYDVSEENLFGRKSVLIKMDTLAGAQTEGICFLDDDTLLLSCESTINFPAQVFSIDLKTLK